MDNPSDFLDDLKKLINLFAISRRISTHSAVPSRQTSTRYSRRVLISSRMPEWCWRVELASGDDLDWKGESVNANVQEVRIRLTLWDVEVTEVSASRISFSES